MVVQGVKNPLVNLLLLEDKTLDEVRLLIPFPWQHALHLMCYVHYTMITREIHVLGSVLHRAMDFPPLLPRQILTRW